MRVAVYSITRDRLDFTKKSFKALRGMAGLEIDHYVADNGSRDDMVEYLREMEGLGKIHTLHVLGENKGQNIAANGLLDEMEGYDWIVRWDNDMMPRTRRFLRKLLRVGERCQEYGVFPVISANITKLMHPPPTLRVVELEELELEQIEIAGGQCRAHPGKLFDEWRYNEYAPLGLGEAAEMARLAKEAEFPILRVPNVDVEHMHGHLGQVELLPEEHTWKRREVGRYVGYGL